MPKNKAASARRASDFRGGFFHRAASSALASLKGGFFGRAVITSGAGHSFHHSQKAGGVFSGGARVFSRLVEKSAFYRFMSRAANRMLISRLRVYGVFLLTFGLYTTVINMVLAMFAGESRSLFELFCGVCSVIVSFPLIFAGETLSGALCRSEFGRWIVEISGIRMESVRRSGADGRCGGAFIAGAVLGILAYFLSPLTAVFIILKAVFAWVTFLSPEFGIPAMFLLFPFVSPKTVAFISVICVVSFILKLFRGKRYMSLTAADAAVFAMVIIIFAASAVSGGEILSGGIRFALPAAGYFLSVIIIKSRKWSYTSVSAYLTSVGAVAACLIFQRSLGALGIYGDITVLLCADDSLLSGGGASFAPCFAAAIPVALGMALDPLENIRKRTAVFTLISSAAALLLLGQTGMLSVSLLISFAILVVRNGKNIYAFISAVLLCVTAVVWFPQILKIVSAAESKADAVLSAYGLASDVSVSGGYDSAFSAFMSDLFPFVELLAAVVAVAVLCMSVSFFVRSGSVPDRILSSVRSPAADGTSYTQNDSARLKALTSLRLGALSPFAGAASFMLIFSGAFVWSGGVVAYIMWLLLGLSPAFVTSSADELSLNRPFGPERKDSTMSSLEMERLPANDY